MQAYLDVSLANLKDGMALPGMFTWRVEIRCIPLDNVMQDEIALLLSDMT